MKHPKEFSQFCHFCTDLFKIKYVFLFYVYWSTSCRNLKSIGAEMDEKWQQQRWGPFWALTAQWYSVIPTVFFLLSCFSAIHLHGQIQFLSHLVYMCSSKNHSIRCRTHWNHCFVDVAPQCDIQSRILSRIQSSQMRFNAKFPLLNTLAKEFQL